MSALTEPSAAVTAPSLRVQAAVARALRDGGTHYTDRAGIGTLRARLTAALGRGAEIAAERAIITAGPREALFLALAALVGAGGHVLGGDPDEAELLHSLGIERTDSPDQAAALLVRVDPALGVSAADRDRIASGLAQGLTVIVCERPRPGATSLAAAGLADDVIIVGALAVHGAERWAGGYVIGPAPLVRRLIDLKQGLNICTSALAQHALVTAAEECAEASAPPLPADRGRTARRPSGRAPRAALASLSDEGTRQRYELLDLLAATPGAITLGRGDPDLPTPPEIVEAGIAAMSGPVGDGADPLGLPALRRAIAGKLARDNGVLVDPDGEVLVTTGGQEAIFLLLQALAGSGDEILMPGPRYTSYDVAINMAGARVVTVPPLGPLDFRLDVGAVEALITERTRALLIITPGNPTACVADRVRLEAVADVARRHDLLLIADEMYERIVYDGVQHVSLASLAGMAERTITVGGFSKSYAMTGWRVGYLAGPAELVARVAALKQLWSGPTAPVSQRAALAAVTSLTDLAAPALAEYAVRREIALAALAEMGLPYAPSEGAFYAFFDISSLAMSSYEASRRLLTEAGVFLYPGSGFGQEWSGYMRMAWLQPRERLQEALARMGDWVQGQR